MGSRTIANGIVMVGGVMLVAGAVLCTMPVMMVPWDQIDAPTAEDQVIAEEYTEIAYELGVDQEVTARDIAIARRTGELEVLEEATAEYREERARAERAAEPVHVAGAYYPEEQTEADASAGSLWLWGGVAVGAVFALFGSLGAVAFLLFGGGNEEDEVIDVDGSGEWSA